MSGAARHAGSLRTLKALLDEGVLDEDEYRAEKTKLLRTDISPTPTSTTDAPVLSVMAGVEAAMLKLSSMADAMTKVMATAAEGTARAPKRTHSEVFEPEPAQPTVWTPSDQPTLFASGVQVRKVIKKPLKKPLNLKMVGGGHKCPHCDFVSPKPGPLAMHVKHNHPKKMKTGDRSLLSCLANQGVSLSERQKARARDVEIAFLITDIVKTAESTAKLNLKKKKKRGFLQTGSDGRKCNGGADRRQRRSYTFKAKVIDEHERLTMQAAARAWWPCVHYCRRPV